MFFSDLKLRDLANLYGLKNWLWHSKPSKSHKWRHFYDVIKFMLMKIHHQN